MTHAAPTPGPEGAPERRSPRRWECPCDEDHPVLLGVVDERGVLEVKDRGGWYYFTGGTVTAICWRCGAANHLDLSKWTTERKDAAA